MQIFAPDPVRHIVPAAPTFALDITINHLDQLNIHGWHVRDGMPVAHYQWSLCLATNARG